MLINSLGHDGGQAFGSGIKPSDLSLERGKLSQISLLAALRPSRSPDDRRDFGRLFFLIL